MELPVINLASGREACLRCHPVMSELRPHLADAERFLVQVARQQAQGYRLVCVEADGLVRAVAGFRLLEKLSAGKFLYVDDLVTRAGDRSKGYGGMVFDWLVEHAAANGCTQLQLDSGVQRFGAHRFYLRKGMNITCHHFDLEVSSR